MIPGIYKFKDEFCKELKIPANQYDRRNQNYLNGFPYQLYILRTGTLFLKRTSRLTTSHKPSISF